MTATKAASNKDMDSRKIINLGAPTPGSNDAARQVDLDTVQAYAISRANHTGSQTASTISDFDTQVRANRLDQLTAPTGSVGLNGQRLINVGSASGGTDAVNLNDLNTAIAAIATGQTLKGTVRAVSTTNVNTASAPSTIDGITPANGEVYLLAGQSTGSQNGPWVFNGAGSAMTRATNWDAAGEAVVGSYWIVREGTNADKFALLNNDTFTLGSTTAAFTYIGLAPTLNVAVEQDMGNGAATSFAITHNFGTRAVHVSVYRVASPYDEPDVYIERTDLNTVTVKPDAVWATNEFHAVVSKA
jgi:hypothetical protein